MSAFTVIIPGEPVAKGRPRITKFGTYTPKKTREWERATRILFGQAMFLEGRKTIAGPCRLHVVAIFSITASWPAWKKQAAMQGMLMHTAKPDGDNIVKIVKDALNGVAWSDDAQVVTHSADKTFGESPSITITVEPIDGLPCQIKKRFELDAYLLNKQEQ